MGPIKQPGKRNGAWYIITTTDYLTRWAKATLVVDCIAATTTRFLFDNVVIRFGCPNILMSDQGSHFINRMVSSLIEKLQIQHNKITHYYS